jgi:Fe2+ or Zn2+ uptake regulation protein
MSKLIICGGRDWPPQVPDPWEWLTATERVMCEILNEADEPITQATLTKRMHKRVPHQSHSTYYEMSKRLALIGMITRLKLRGRWHYWRV